MKREKIVIFMLNAREKVKRNKKRSKTTSNNTKNQHEKPIFFCWLLVASGACAFQLYFYILRTKNFIY